MSGDARSFEEAVLAALTERPDIASPGTRTRATKMANALREWCLAPQQIERAAMALTAITLCDPPCSTCTTTARAALHAVMGDTP